MKTVLEILPCGHVGKELTARIESWAREIPDAAAGDNSPARISIFLWERTQAFEAFDAREKTELGITTAGESEFLATHEAWRGYPRIHIPIEKIKDLSDDLIRGIIQHEIGHALLHGNPEFYLFRFSSALQEAGSRAGLDWPRLQQLVYWLAVALKDAEVVQLLSEQGLGIYQIRFLEYLLAETNEEKQIWEMIREDPALSRLGMAAFLKTRLPIEALAGSGLPEAGRLIGKWETAYSWLTDSEKKELRALARFVLEGSGTDFQYHLEQAVLQLINKASSRKPILILLGNPGEEGSLLRPSFDNRQIKC
jgi:hypothetical protein